MNKQTLDTFVCLLACKRQEVSRAISTFSLHSSGSFWFLWVFSSQRATVVDSPGSVVGPMLRHLCVFGCQEPCGSLTQEVISAPYLSSCRPDYSYIFFFSLGLVLTEGCESKK